MLVIGAGQGRTGTDSLRVALNALGVGPTYHMSELLGIDASRPVSPLELLGLAAGHADRWTDVEAALSSSTAPDFGFLAEHYRSAVDYPAAAYFQELLAAYPDAKVVLTVRDPADVLRSARETWCRIIGASGSPLDRFAAWAYSLRPYGRRFLRLHAAFGRGTARALGRDGVAWNRVCEDEAYGVEFFEAWDARVRDVVPAEKLLVFETGKHGYEELVEFLGVEAPGGMSYPRSNSREEFAFVINVMRATAVLTFGLPVAALAWCLRRWCRKSAGNEEKKKL